MSNAVMILGHSGSGKTTSLRNLDPKTTYIIRAIEKPLPFKGWKASYNKDAKNLMDCDTSSKICSAMRNISEKAGHIKTIVIDDAQYIMANEFMRRAGEVGFNKFSDIGRNMWDILSLMGTLRDDLVVFMLAHTEENDSGLIKMKTIGKMLDDKVSCEGMVTIVLRSFCNDGTYGFFTQNNGRDTTKSPMGMFDTMVIDNDLEMVRKAIIAYNE
jgi:hypothetical protein